MRVFVVAMTPTADGGRPIVELQVAAALVERGHSVAMAHYDPGDLVSRWEAVARPVKRVRRVGIERRAPWRSLGSTVFSALARTAPHRCDVVYVPQQEATVLGGLLARLWSALSCSTPTGTRSGAAATMRSVCDSSPARSPYPHSSSRRLAER